MTIVGTIEAHRSRCQPSLLTLRMIAHDDTDSALTRRVAVEVARAAQAVLDRFEALTAAIWTVLRALYELTNKAIRPPDLLWIFLRPDQEIKADIVSEVLTGYLGTNPS